MGQKKDAARYRYQQHPEYFTCGPYDTDGDWQGFSVGILKYVDDPRARYSDPPYKRQLPLNQCIEGRGDTLEKAIDAALKRKKVCANK
jgi:hypothetical protein